MNRLGDSKGQIDFYDQPALVARAADVLAGFFRAHLAREA